MWLILLLVSSCCVLGALCTDPRSQFVHRLLSVYRSSKDQAKAADRDSDGNISDNEFLQSLFLFADTDVRDRRVTQAEFIDGYRRYFALPSELLVVMFDLLDDLNDDGGTRQNMGYRDNRNNQYFHIYFQFARGNNVFQNNYRNQGDGVLTSRDVTYQTFVGNNNRPSVDDFQKALITWVEEAANRLYTINYQPHIPGNPWDREFDYEQWFHTVDKNNDSLISFGELRDEFRRYSNDGRVTRARWTERNMQAYEDKEWLSNVVFDFWDKNRDLRLDDLDIALILRQADQNQDRRVTSVEFHRLMERYNKLARRRLATPVRPLIFDCPSPWWQSFGCRPRVDATRAAMDMDDNFDGWITPREFGKRISYYDRNGDGWASRFEVVSMETLRYGVSGPAASILFDIYDRNSDGRYDHLDLQFMLPEGRLLCFCDARKAVLELVRLAERFRFSPQAQGPVGSLRNAMRWQLAREWAWRDRNRNIWRWLAGQSPYPWGTGGCREGDCTGRDWRGTGWYSPFDWRQKNRVPENFLQWSYLQDVPRTVFLPPGFRGGSVAFPGQWWSQQWHRNMPEDSGSRDRQDGNKDQEDGSNDRRKPSFAVPTWLTEGGTFDNLWNFPGDENDTNPFWSGPGSFWSNPNANFWEQLNRQGGPLPWWIMSGGMDNRNEERSVQAPWFFNWDPSMPGRSGNRDDQKGVSSPQSRVDNTWKAVTTTVASVATKQGAQGTTTDAGAHGPAGPLQSSKGGKRPQDSASRFRRQATPPKEELNQTSAESLPPPPSLSDSNNSSTNATSVNDTLGVAFAEDSNFTINGTDLEENRTRSDENKDLAEEREEIARAMARNRNPSSQSSLWDFTAWKDSADNLPSGSGYGDWSDASNPWQDTPTQPSAWSINRWWDNNQMGDNRWINSYLGDTPAGSSWQAFDYWSKTYPGNRNGGLSYSSWPVWRSYDSYSPQVWAGYTGYSGQYPPGQSTGWEDYWNKVGGGGAYYPPSYVSYPHHDQSPFGYYSSGQLGLWKRSVDARQDPSTSAKQTSRMMGGVPTYWPWWSWWNFYGNFYNNHASWPYHWILYNQRNQWFPWYQDRNWGYNWMGSNFGNGHLFSKTNENHQTSSDAKLEVRRSTNEGEETVQGENVSRWLTGYEPQWWNSNNGMGRTWSSNNMLSAANFWNWNWNWNMYQKMLGIHNPSQFRSSDFIPGTRLPIVSPDRTQLHKRSAESTTETKEGTSRWMDGSGLKGWWGWNSYWPLWNSWRSYNPLWNSWRSYNPLWNNWRSYNPLWNSYAWQDNDYPSYDFSRDSSTPNNNQNGIHKRSTGEDNKDRMSRQMGGWNWFWPPYWRSYWPQWWNRNFWTNYWYNWNSRMWNTDEGYYPYGSFSFMRNGKGQLHDGSHTSVRRSPKVSLDSDLNDNEKGKSANMMSGYWPQKYSSGYSNYPQQYWNGYSYWPQWWGSYMWSRRNWPDWNPWTNNNWIWSGSQPNYPYTPPFYYSQGDVRPESSQGQDRIVKRNAEENSERSSEEQNKQVSRMMSGYGGYGPQWWTGSQFNTKWPWSWSQSYSPPWPSYFAQRPQSFGGSQSCGHTAFKRSADRNHENTEKEKKSSRMMGGYDFMPEQFRPGWNFDNQGWNGRVDFSPSAYYYFQRNMWPSDSSFRAIFRRSAEEKEKEVSQDPAGKPPKMMNGYRRHWPQLGNMINWNQLWSSFWNIRNSWMWNNGQGFNPYNSFYFSTGSPHASGIFKRSTFNEQSTMSEAKSEKASRMTGMYGDFWPQQYWSPYSSWWNRNMWNSYWPRSNAVWMAYGPWGSNPVSFMFSQADPATSEAPQDSYSRFRRTTDRAKKGEVTDNQQKVALMRDRYGGSWPQFWNTFSHWPRWWTGLDGMNSYWPLSNPYYWSASRSQPFFPYSPYYYMDVQDGHRPSSPELSHDVFKRNVDGNTQDHSQSKDENVSRMTGWWPQGWNSYTYWPQWWTGYYNWNNWPEWNPYNWRWNRNQPFFPYSSYFYSQGGPRPEVYPDYTHDVFKRSADENSQDHSQSKEENVSRMTGWGPQSWNSYTYWPQWWTGYYNWNNWPEWNPYNWRWNRNQPFFPYASYYYSQGGPRPEAYPDFIREVFKRSADVNTQGRSQGQSQNVSRMTGWWPQAPVSYTYWPRWWSGSQMDGRYNGNWQYPYWNRYPFWSQWGNRNVWDHYGPGWNRNWMGAHNQHLSDMFAFSKGQPLPHSSGEARHDISRRESKGTEEENVPDKNKAGKMMGHNAWFRPYNWNFYSYWPQWWSQNFWNRYWSTLSNWNRYDWMWNSNPGVFSDDPFFYSYPYSRFSFLRDSSPMGSSPRNGHAAFRRSVVESSNEASQDKTILRMAGWHGWNWPQMYWPQWRGGSVWQDWNPWNRYNWMWRGSQAFLPYSPYFYAQMGIPPGSSEYGDPAIYKRSTEAGKHEHSPQDGDNTAKLIGGYAGYWPQQYWTSQSYWPWWWGGNGWNSYWPGWSDYARMWSTYNSWYPLFSYQVSQKNENPGKETDYKHPVFKRSPEEDKNAENKERVDRWKNINNFWPDMQGYNNRLPWKDINPFWDSSNQVWNNWNVFNSQGRYPPNFNFFTEGSGQESPDTQPMLTKRDTTQVIPGKSSEGSTGLNLMDLLKKNNFWQTPGNRNANNFPKPTVSKRSTDEQLVADNNLSRQVNGDRQNPSQLERSLPLWAGGYNYFRPGPFTGHFLITTWNDDKMSNVNKNDLGRYWDWNSDQKGNDLYQNNARQDNFWMGNDWDIYNRPVQDYWNRNNWNRDGYGFGFPYFAANDPIWSSNPDFSYQKGADVLSENKQEVKSNDSEDHEVSKRSTDDKTNVSVDGENLLRQTSSYGTYMARPQWWNQESFYRPPQYGPPQYGNRYMWRAYEPWNTPYHMWRNWPRHNRMWNDQIPEWMWNNWLMTSNGQSWHNIEDVNWNINGYSNGHGITDPPQFRFENQEGIQEGNEGEAVSVAADSDRKVSKRSADEDQTPKPQEEDVKRQFVGYNYFPSYRPWSRLWRGYSYYWPMGQRKRYFWNRWNYPEWYNFLWNNWYWNYRSRWNTQMPSTDLPWNINMYTPAWDSVTREFPQYFTTPMPSLSTTAETRQKQYPYTTPKTPKVDSKTDSEHKTTLSKRSAPFDQGQIFRDSDIPLWTRNPTSPDFRNDYSQRPAWLNMPQFYDPRLSQIFFMNNGHVDPLQNSPTWDTYIKGRFEPSVFRYSKEGTTQNKAAEEAERVMRRRSAAEVKEETEDPESKSKDPDVSRWINDNVFRTRELFRPGWHSMSFGRPWQWNPYSFQGRQYPHFPWWTYRNWYSPSWYSSQLWRNTWMANPQMWRYDDTWESPSWNVPTSVGDTSQLWNSLGQDERFWPLNYWPGFDSTWNVDVNQFSPSATSDDGMQFTGAPETGQQNQGDEVEKKSVDYTQHTEGVTHHAAGVTQHSLNKRSETFVAKGDLDHNLRSSRQSDRLNRIYSRLNQLNRIYHGSTGQIRGNARKRLSQKDKRNVPSRQRRFVFNTRQPGWLDNFGQGSKPYWISGSWEISGNNQPWSKWTHWNKWNGGFVWNDQSDNLDSFSPFQSFSRTGPTSASKDKNVQKRSAEPPENQDDITVDDKSDSKPGRWMNDYGVKTPMGMDFNWPGYFPWQPLASYDGVRRSNPLWYGTWNRLRNFRPLQSSFPADQMPYDFLPFLRKRRAAVPPDQDVVAVEPELDREQMFSKWMNSYGQMPGSWPMWMRNKWQMQNFDLMPGWTNAYHPAAGWEKPGWTGDPAWAYQPWKNKMMYENYWSDGQNLDPRFSQYFSRSDDRDQDVDNIDRSSSPQSQKESESTVLNSEDSQAERDVISLSSQNDRTRRGTATLATVLSKGRLRHKSSTKSNTVSSSKDLGPRKIKRFSAEAEARLQIRLQKRSNRFEMISPATGQPSAERTTSSGSTTESIRPQGKQGTSTTNASPAAGRAMESSGQEAKTFISPTGHSLSQTDLSSPAPRPDLFRPHPTDSLLDETKAEGRHEEISNANRPDKDNDSETMLSEYNFYDQDSQKWLNFYNPDTQNTSTSASSYGSNTSQWNDWLQLWAYGPNFWDSLASWDGYPFPTPWNRENMNFNPSIWSNSNFRNFGNPLTRVGLTGCGKYWNYAGPLNYDASLSRMAHDYFSTFSDLYRNLWDDNCVSNYESGVSVTGQSPVQGGRYPLTGPASQRGGWNQWGGAWDTNPGYTGPCSYCRPPSNLLQDSCCQSWFAGTAYGQGFPATRFPPWQERGPRSSYQDVSVWGSPWQLNQFQDRSEFEHPQFQGRHPQTDSLGDTQFSGPLTYDQNLARIQNWQLWNNYWNSRLRGRQMGWNQSPQAFGRGLWGATAAHPGEATPFPDSWRYRQQETPGGLWPTGSQPWNQQNWGNRQAGQFSSTGNDASSWDVLSGIGPSAPFGGDDSSFSVSPPTDLSDYGDSGPSSPMAGGTSIFGESSTGTPSFTGSDSGPLFPRPGPDTYANYMTTGASARLDSPISTPAFGPAGTTPEFKGRQAFSNAGNQPLAEFQQTVSKDC